MVVLGLDAAWTQHHDTGCAVVVGEPGQWCCLAAVSSYRELFRLTGCADVLKAAESIAGAPVDLASVDMPLARVPIISRRTSDTAISRAFGVCGCSVHSPSPARPGAVSTDLMCLFSQAGYDLAVCGSAVGHRQVIEVYPHIAVMRLLNASYRIPYKVGRIRQYWPNATPVERKKNLHGYLTQILEALRDKVAGVQLQIPSPDASAAELKRFEDAMDAVVCAWIGTQYLEGKCQPYGDNTAAIWVPTDS